MTQRLNLPHPPSLSAITFLHPIVAATLQSREAPNWIKAERKLREETNVCERCWMIVKAWGREQVRATQERLTARDYYCVRERMSYGAVSWITTSLVNVRLSLGHLVKKVQESSTSWIKETTATSILNVELYYWTQTYDVSLGRTVSTSSLSLHLQRLVLENSV